MYTSKLKIKMSITAETITRHDEKTSVGRAKVLSGGDTRYSVRSKYELRTYMQNRHSLFCIEQNTDGLSSTEHLSMS